MANPGNYRVKPVLKFSLGRMIKKSILLSQTKRLTVRSRWLRLLGTIMNTHWLVR